MATSHRQSGPDQERLAVLWTRAQPAVSAYVSSLVPDFHQTEDVLGQVAAVLVRKFSEYDPTEPFVNWAMGIARYEILKHRGRQASDKHVLANDLVAAIHGVYEELSEEWDPRRRALQECLQRIEGRGREALVLRYTHNVKPKNIAGRLGMTAGAARALLHRVRGELRRCIDRKLTQQGRAL